MTEQEARQKWCPFYRITELGWVQNATDNRGWTLEENVLPNCIASGCMAWRWLNDPNDPDTHEHDVLHGYCGLAGKP